MKLQLEAEEIVYIGYPIEKSIKKGEIIEVDDKIAKNLLKSSTKWKEIKEEEKGGEE
ncbi:MAG: hypothetical protein QXS18_05600 [Thermoplasmata archaeon]